MAARQSVRAIVATAIRRSAAPLAVTIALLGPVGINAASADVTYTSYSWTGDTVTITGPSPLSPINSETGGAGQIRLHLSTGQTLLAWCLDVFDWLQTSGTYSVTQNGPINNGQVSASTAAHIGGLMVEGNNLIQANHTLTIGTNSFSVADESAATQIAIWAAEYGAGFTYKTSIMPAGFTDLVAYIDARAGTSTYFTLDPDPINCPKGQTTDCTSPTNQHLGYVPVPSPIAGAGLPGLAVACTALLALARRRRQAIA